MGWVLLIGGLVLLGIFVYWQFIIAEGTYFGPRVVVLLYDWAASAYERIKQFDASYEQWFLGLPLAQALEAVSNPLVLDVGTGTGRLPRALLFQPNFRGRVLGLDLSRRMLSQAVRLSQPYAGRVTYIWQDARTLPFPAGTFDAVTCLEVLEFTPDPPAILRELVRVLRPGGVLVVTNRVGRDAPWMPKRTFARPAFETLLQTLPLEDIKVQVWQADYDLAWALKKGAPKGGGVRSLPEILHCPACEQGPLLLQGGVYYYCEDCDRRYPVAVDGVVEMAG